MSNPPLPQACGSLNIMEFSGMSMGKHGHVAAREVVGEVVVKGAETGFLPSRDRLCLIDKAVLSTPGKNCTIKICHSAFTPQKTLLTRFTIFDYRGIIFPVTVMQGAFLFLLKSRLSVCASHDCDKHEKQQVGGFSIGASMKTNRRLTYKKRWKELIEIYGARCYYCRKEAATTIDHVVPYSWDAVNDIENLVPACALCNAIAGDKMFEDVEQKRQYILSQRAKRSNMRAVCVECLLPFTYRAHSPSMFLCAECYDLEYPGDHYSESPEWHRWIEQLRHAGIAAEAHRKMRARMSKVERKARDEKLEVLIDEYSYIVDTDDEFAEMLMVC